RRQQWRRQTRRSQRQRGPTARQNDRCADQGDHFARAAAGRDSLEGTQRGGGMSVDVFDFECSAGTTGDVKHAVRKAKFGDGYGQIAKDGINSRSSVWTVQMQNLR